MPRDPPPLFAPLPVASKSFELVERVGAFFTEDDAEGTFVEEV
jgi:hypothetical protein